MLKRTKVFERKRQRMARADVANAGRGRIANDESSRDVAAVAEGTSSEIQEQLLGILSRFLTDDENVEEPPFCTGV